MSKRGWRSRPNFLIQWEGAPTAFGSSFIVYCFTPQVWANGSYFSSPLSLRPCFRTNLYRGSSGGYWRPYAGMSRNRSVIRNVATNSPLRVADHTRFQPSVLLHRVTPADSSSDDLHPDASARPLLLADAVPRFAVFFRSIHTPAAASSDDLQRKSRPAKRRSSQSRTSLPQWRRSNPCTEAFGPECYELITTGIGVPSLSCTCRRAHLILGVMLVFCGTFDPSFACLPVASGPFTRALPTSVFFCLQHAQASHEGSICTGQGKQL